MREYGGDILHILYALKLKPWLRSNSISKSFLLRNCGIDRGAARIFLRGELKLWKQKI